MRKKCHGLIVFVVCVGSVLLCYFLRRKYISKKDKNTLYAKNDWIKCIATFMKVKSLY